jgi:hypothetical protein
MKAGESVLNAFALESVEMYLGSGLWRHFDAVLKLFESGG